MVNKIYQENQNKTVEWVVYHNISSMKIAHEVERNGKPIIVSHSIKTNELPPEEIDDLENRKLDRLMANPKLIADMSFEYLFYE